MTADFLIRSILSPATNRAKDEPISFAYPPCLLFVACGIASAVASQVMALRRWAVIRRLKLAAQFVGVALVVFEGPGIFIGIKAARAHGRIEAALAHAETCGFEKVTADLDEWGSDEERSKVKDAQSRCDEAEARRKLAELCTRVATKFDANALTDADMAGVDETVTKVLQRARDHKLGTDDFATADKLLTAPGDFTCAKDVGPRLVKMLAASPEPWTVGVEVPDGVKHELQTAGLAPAVVAAIGARADEAAKSALKRTKTADMAPANAFCSLATYFKVAAGPACTALARKYTMVKAREEAAAKMADAARDAKEQRCDQIRERSLNCSMACMDRFDDPTDPRGDACEARCNAGLKAAGCVEP